MLISGICWEYLFMSIDPFTAASVVLLQAYGVVRDFLLQLLNNSNDFIDGSFESISDADWDSSGSEIVSEGFGMALGVEW